jgi:hypothetical protein
MDAVGKIAQLKALLLEMEADIGLTSLSSNERDVLYAAVLAAAAEGAVVHTRDMRDHPLTKAMSVPTFHRVLRALLDKGYLDHAPNTLAGAYLVIRRI